MIYYIFYTKNLSIDEVKMETNAYFECLYALQYRTCIEVLSVFTANMSKDKTIISFKKRSYIVRPKIFQHIHTTLQIIWGITQYNFLLISCHVSNNTTVDYFNQISYWNLNHFCIRSVLIYICTHTVNHIYDIWLTACVFLTDSYTSTINCQADGNLSATNIHTRMCTCIQVIPQFKLCDALWTTSLYLGYTI